MKYKYNEIGDRIRNLRQNNGMTQDALIEEFRNMGYGISRNTLSKIENGVEQAFTFDFLRNFCQIFGCDIGFLLGEYKEKKVQIHQISSITGLSETAIENLILWNASTDLHKNWPDYISSIITSGHSEELFKNMSNIMGYTKVERKAILNNTPSLAIDMIDMQMAQLWYISKTFSNIIEDMTYRVRINKGDK